MSVMSRYRRNIERFANEHALIFTDKGECGFCRECIGLLFDDCYVAYNPRSGLDYHYIPKFYDIRLSEIIPADAYHKHNSLAVLGRDEDKFRQLSEWVDALEGLNVTIESYWDEGGFFLHDAIKQAVRVNKADR